MKVRVVKKGILHPFFEIQTKYRLLGRWFTVKEFSIKDYDYDANEAEKMARNVAICLWDIRNRKETVFEM